jgi:hypothetical protein
MSWSFFAPGPSFSSYGTSLPGSPVDGQEATLVDSITVATYQWRFRYNAGSANTDKWEFVGGVPAEAFVATLEYRNNTAYGDSSTAGPSFTVPRAGVYSISYGFQGRALDVTSSYEVWGSPSINAGAPADADAVVMSAPAGPATANTQYHPGMMKKTAVTIGASQVIKLQVKQPTGASATRSGWEKRWLTVLPVRVS